MAKNIKLSSKLLEKRSNLSATLGDILATLAEKFPNGFHPSEGTIFLKKHYFGGHTKYSSPNLEMNGQETTVAGIYKALADADYLKILEKSHGKGKQFRYQVYVEKLGKYYQLTQEKMLSEEHIKSDFAVPLGLLRLLNGRSTLMGIPRDKGLQEGVQDALESIILRDEHFLQIMSSMKQHSPKGYAHQGGDYLDYLLQHYKKQK